jgi:anti-sigma factor ChrR (cupin superfamily)
MTQAADERREIIATRAEGAFRPYDRYGSAIEGLSWLPLSRDETSDHDMFLLRFAPGARSRPHRHEGLEQFLVLDGLLVDDDGTAFQPGDFVRFASGSEHSSQSPEGCLLLVSIRGRNRPL